MITTTQFYSHLSKPAEIDASVVKDLDTIIEQYPYFQTARLLRLKGLHNLEALNYQDELRITAAYAANREVLYHLLMKDRLIKTIEAHEAETELIPENPTTSETDPKEGSNTISKEVKAEQQATPDKKQEHIEDLEKQVLEHAITASLSYELDPELTNQKTSAEKKSSETPIESKGAPTPDLSSPKSFTSWIKELNQDTTVSNLPIQPVENIIDNFIQTEPKIGDTKASFFSPENMARLSLVEKDDFVTETLANIYEKQGYLERAIKAFRNLSLKYPEKSTYFAGRIKKIEQQLKEK